MKPGDTERFLRILKRITPELERAYLGNDRARCEALIAEVRSALPEANECRAANSKKN